MTAATKRKSQPMPTAASALTDAAVASTTTGRKPWKKKTPTEVVLDQIERVREDVEQKREELKHAERQLQRLEEAKKVLEST